VTITVATGYGVPRLRYAAEIPLVALAGIALADLWQRVGAWRRARRDRAQAAVTA